MKNKKKYARNDVNEKKSNKHQRHNIEYRHTYVMNPLPLLLQ